MWKVGVEKLNVKRMKKSGTKWERRKRGKNQERWNLDFNGTS